MSKVLIFYSNVIRTDLFVSCFKLKLSHFNTKPLSFLTFNKVKNIYCKAKADHGFYDHNNFCNQDIFHRNSIALNNNRFIHLNRIYYVKKDKKDRKSIISRAAKKDEGNEGEESPVIDLGLNVIRGFGNIFPDETTDEQLFDGIKYKDLPIVHISLSRNNTILDVTDSQGCTLTIRSCGMEGFKNAKKGTNIAAQSTATTFASRAIEKGVRTVRVTLNGLGPGRITAPKGLVIGGLNIVSVTDVTPISFQIFPRPRKMRH